MAHKRVVHCKQRGYDVYIGRASGNHHFGNPFAHKLSKFDCVVVKTREDAVAAFRDWIMGVAWQDVEPERREWIIQQLPSLKGKVLGCFCAPLSCHGDVLAEMADNL